MGIDRGALSRIDRKLLAGLDTDERWRVVRLPASEALWSAWKRYCSAIGISMGRGLYALIQRELEAVIGSEPDVDFLSAIESQIHDREEALNERERRLAERETKVERRERTATLAGRTAAPAVRTKVGRNDLCSCGSGVKYKRCHGT
ncbi:MAG: SEC-C metal-binding domain-containing protein [Acidimicrobiia bacterium]